jgi:hypothetical protein
MFNIDIGVKREMFYLLTRTIGDCGFKVVDNPVARRADGGKASFHYFVTQNQDVAAALHDVRGHTKLSINLFLSGIVDKRHAEECWNAVEATLRATGHQIAP